MPPRDDLSITDREILLLVRSDVQNLTKAFDAFVAEQKCCNNDLEHRVRTIEIAGSKEAGEAIKRVETLETKVATIETNCNRETAGEEAVSKWYATNLGQAGILIGISLGILGFALDLYFRLVQ